MFIHVKHCIHIQNVPLEDNVKYKISFEITPETS